VHKRAITVLVIAIFVSSVAYAQIAAGVMFLRKRVHRITQQGPEEVDKVTKELAEELSLTPEQQDKVKSIVLETKENIEKALSQAGEAIDSLLTDEQKAKFGETRKKIKNEIKTGPAAQE
jgi:Spy/CpxP family protein refolding chaperone